MSSPRLELAVRLELEAAADHVGVAFEVECNLHIWRIPPPRTYSSPMRREGLQAKGQLVRLAFCPSPAFPIGYRHRFQRPQALKSLGRAFVRLPHQWQASGCSNFKTSGPGFSACPSRFLRRTGRLYRGRAVAGIRYS